MTDTESAIAQKQRAAKNVAIFLFLGVNGVWAFTAYLLHRVGLPLGLIASVVVLGAVLGNFAVYVGIRFAGRMLRKSGNA